METARLLAKVTHENQQARVLCEQLLTDSDPDVGCHAALGLARAGAVEPAVWQALSHYDSSYVQIETEVRQFIGSLPDPYAELQRLLHSDQPVQRLSASKLLALRGPETAGPVTEALVVLLVDDDPEVRFRAAEALARIAGTESIRNRIGQEQFAAKQPEMTALQAVIQMITSQSWTALAACEKLVAGQVLLPADGQALARLSVRSLMTPGFSVAPDNMSSIGCGPGKKTATNSVLALISHCRSCVTPRGPARGAAGLRR